MSPRRAYQEQLQVLHNELTEMSRLCIQAVQSAVQAITTGDRLMAEQTNESDDVIDKKEKDIESLCLKLLLQQQPVAADMRSISSALKMISDLERIGDQAADIADISQYVVVQDGASADDLRSMSEEVVKIVNESVTAFVQNNLVMAREAITCDDKVDEWLKHIKNDLISDITKDNTRGEYYLEVLMVAKYLERIGDHAVNVAEWVTYSILGHRQSEAE